MKDLKLPGLDSPIVRDAEHFVRPFEGDSERFHRIHVSRREGNWEWAHLVRMVGGWEVVSAGMLSGSLYSDHDKVAQYIAEQARGAGGDGFDELTHDGFMQQGTIAHIRRETDRHTAYCGTGGGGPAVFSVDKANHVEQHCINCKRAYQAEHYGRVAVTH